MTERPGVFTKRAPVGIYDKNILCKTCENLFQEFDDYAARFLIQEQSLLQPLLDRGRVIAHVARDFDYALLKLFFVSVLWRAHLSAHEVYSRVNLGPYADQAFEMIKSGDPGSPLEFSVVFARFQEHLAEKVILDPHPEKWWGVNAYRFYMGGFIVHIKVDKRKFPSPMADFIMQPDMPLVIVARELETSHEFAVMKSIVRDAT